MTSIEHITIEADSVDAGFYDDVLGLDWRVRVVASSEATTGFRGFVLGLVVAQPVGVDGLMESTENAGAVVLKPPSKSLWGYGGALQAPDGTVITVASSTKKNTGPTSRKVDEIVLQLGVADVVTSRRFYAERGLAETKSFGRSYVEFATGPVSLTLNARGALAKTVGLSADGTGSHRLVIGSDAGAFSDPDGYVWSVV